jgi:branched-chain amino acid transport system ATP-binding protein
VQLEVRGIAGGYGATAEVLHDVGLHVDAGEVVALLGRNGVGKTHPAASGHGAPAAGRGDGAHRRTDASGLPTHQRARLGLGYVPQGRDLFPDLLGRAEPALRPPPGRRIRCPTRCPATCSSGSRGCTIAARSAPARSRVASSRWSPSPGCSSGRPKVLLLDEPTEGLAPVMVQQVAETIREIAGVDGPGMLLVEQNVTFALRSAQRGYVMEKGTHRDGRPGGRARQRGRPDPVPVDLRGSSMVSMQQVAEAAGVSRRRSRGCCRTPLPRPRGDPRPGAGGGEGARVPAQPARPGARHVAHLHRGGHRPRHLRPYFGEIVRGIEDVARAERLPGARVELRPGPQRELEILELMLAYNVDAVMFSGGSLHDGTTSGVPPAVRQLHRAGPGRRAPRPPPRQGHPGRRRQRGRGGGDDRVPRRARPPRIGLLDGPPQLSTAGVRAEGYRKGLASAGLPTTTPTSSSRGFTCEGGRRPPPRCSTPTPTSPRSSPPTTSWRSAP